MTYTYTCIFAGPNGARNLRIISQTMASLALSWDPPVSGKVVEYNIRLQGVAGKEQTINGSTAVRKVMFDGLNAGTGYTVALVTLSGDQQSDTVEGQFFTSKFKHYCICCVWGKGR